MTKENKTQAAKRVEVRDGHRFVPKDTMLNGRVCLDCGKHLSIFSTNAPCAKAEGR